MGPDDLLCSRNARPYPQKEVKVEAQVEQRSIRSGVFSTLNLDLSLDLSMGRAHSMINQTTLQNEARGSLGPPIRRGTAAEQVFHAAPGELLSCNKLRFQRVVFAELTDAEHAKSQDMSLFINPLHHGIMCRGAHEARSLTELYFKVICFRVEPDFYFCRHIVSPALSWSVK